MKEITLEIPEQEISLFEFRQDDLPGIVYVNTSLTNNALKEIFVWHISIVINLKDLIQNGMPSIEEREIVDPFGDELEKNICGDVAKPNALFLARVTWNGTRELLFRVYDPEPVNDYLQEIISSENYPRAFDYRMEEDFEWEKTEFYLSQYQ